jgi:hypothetical protein
MSSPRISSAPSTPAPIPTTETPPAEPKTEAQPATSSPVTPPATTPASTGPSPLAEDKLEADTKAAELHGQVDKKEGNSLKEPLTDEQKKVDELIANGKNLTADQITDELFYEKFPTLKGQKLASGTNEADTWNQIKKDIVDPRMPVQEKPPAKLRLNKSTPKPDGPQQCDPTKETKLQADLRAAELQKMLGPQSAPANTNLTAEEKRVDQLINGSTKWDANKITDQIFAERNPHLKDTSITTDSPEYPEWQQIKAGIVEPRLKEAQEIRAADVETRWNVDLHGSGSDYAKTDELFYQKFPNMKGQDIKKGSEEHTEYMRIYNEVKQSKQNEFNNAISVGVKEFPGLEPKVLKALLVSESRFDTQVENKYGFAGIAQFGRTAAASSGLIVDGKLDERLEPEKAIPAAARHLKDKSELLENMAFSKYGTPQGDEYWKFVAAAYNGGEDAVTIAMKTAYTNAYKDAKAQGMDDQAAAQYSSSYATQWGNLLEPRDNFKKSPLYAATSSEFPSIAEGKYHEIGGYAEKILTLAREGVLISAGKPAL